MGTKNAAVLRGNVTFNVTGVANCTDDPSLANISEIPILSPPSPGRHKVKRSRTSSDLPAKINEEENNESFKFIHGKKDAFDKLLPNHGQNLRVSTIKKNTRKSLERPKDI